MQSVEIQLFWSGKLFAHRRLEGIGIDDRKALLFARPTLARTKTINHLFTLERVGRKIRFK
jgi:hypothetical protein